MSTVTRGIRVAVLGQPEAAARKRLLDALEQAFPVRFETCTAESAAGLPASIVLDGSDGVPATDGPTFHVAAGGFRNGPLPGSGAEIEVAQVLEIDARVRGLTLPDRSAAGLDPLQLEGSAVVLASRAGDPVWARAGNRHLVALGPDDLSSHERLTDLLRPDRWFSLLPLVHFLRELTAEAAWTPPPLRALFLVDDPNLRWPSYGFLSYRKLADHADEHDYHVAPAMIPMDGLTVHPGAARLFRERANRLSLVIHGNDHLKRELAQDQTESETAAMLAQAQRRVDAFERRSGVPVSRVMTPPHGACSEQTMDLLPRLGFEAACISRPHPWLEGPAPDRPLAGWDPATFVASGTPVIPRIPLRKAASEIALRAFLDQPLVLYGHHDDFSDGLGWLADLAHEVNRLGDVSWQPLAEVARSNFATRNEAGVMEVRAYSRRIRLAVPPDVDAVRVEIPTPDRSPAWRGVSIAGTVHRLEDRGAVWSSEAAAVTPGEHVEVTVPHPSPIDAHALGRRWTGPWPVTRRAMAEARDRVAPLLKRG